VRIPESKMENKSQKMKSVRKNGVLAIISVAAALVGGGCDRHSGEAIVRGKEHIPAAEVVPSPAMSGAASADQPTPDATIVMEDSESAVRGTSKDPRAVDHEQWIVSVEMVKDLRQIEVRVEQPRWKTLKIGDRVKVTYKAGRYTGTVWDSAIE
jgi:hypothetical protein